MKENGTLQVLYDGKVVGKLALMAGRKIAFEYSEEWLETYGGRTIGKILIEVEV